MSVDVLLLILRGITGVLLLAFVGALFWVLWRDYQVAARTVADYQRQRGRLVVLRTGDGVRSVPSDGTADRRPDHLIGASFPLLPLTSVGRGPTNTIVLDDTFCSQDHALITRRGGQWWLEDRDSSNGTQLNGESIAGPVVVSSGDVIRVGRVELKVELDQ